MKLPCLKLAFLIILLSVSVAPVARAGVMVSNLGEATFSSSPLSEDFWFANRFITDAAASSFLLESVTLDLTAAVTPSGGFFVAIYSDAAVRPGVELELLSGETNPATAGSHTFTSAGLSLSPNTSYWVVAGVSTGTGFYGWQMTNSDLFAGSWTIPSTGTHTHSLGQGTDWDPAMDGFARKFSVSAAAVPEPATYALLALGAGAGFFLRKRCRRC
jgi:hypothetical protein